MATFCKFGGGADTKELTGIPEGYIYRSIYKGDTWANRKAGAIPYTLNCSGTVERYQQIIVKCRDGNRQTLHIGNNNSSTTGSTGVNWFAVPVAEITSFDFEWIASKTLGCSQNQYDNNLLYAPTYKGVSVSVLSWIEPI